MSKQSEAMRVYFALHGIKNNDIVEATGIDKSTVSCILTGARAVSKDNAIKLARAYTFDVSFLLTGEGELQPHQSVQQGAIVNGGKVEGGINVSTQPASPEEAALRAENETLRRENEWLRSLVEKAATKG